MTKLVQKSIQAFVASLEQKPFQQRHIRHGEREGKKEFFTQSCATMSPLSLLYLPAVGAILSVVNRPVVLPVASVSMDFGAELPFCQ